MPNIQNIQDRTSALPNDYQCIQEKSQILLHRLKLESQEIFRVVTLLIKESLLIVALGSLWQRPLSPSQTWLEFTQPITRWMPSSIHFCFSHPSGQSSSSLAKIHWQRQSVSEKLLGHLSHGGNPQHYNQVILMPMNFFLKNLHFLVKGRLCEKREVELGIDLKSFCRSYISNQFLKFPPKYYN